MNVDVQLYLSGVKKFFDENPKELGKLIPMEMKELFYDKIAEYASNNVKIGEDVTLTRKQFIDVCVDINTEYSERLYKKTNFGIFCLN